MQMKLNISLGQVRRETDCRTETALPKPPAFWEPWAFPRCSSSFLVVVVRGRACLVKKPQTKEGKNR
jgi:hypothetical protein